MFIGSRSIVTDAMNCILLIGIDTRQQKLKHMTQSPVSEGSRAYP
jgi:hypothetical protein